MGEMLCSCMVAFIDQPSPLLCLLTVKHFANNRRWNCTRKRIIQIAGVKAVGQVFIDPLFLVPNCGNMPETRDFPDIQSPSACDNATRNVGYYKETNRHATKAAPQPSCQKVVTQIC